MSCNHLHHHVSQYRQTDMYQVARPCQCYASLVSYNYSVVHGHLDMEPIDTTMSMFKTLQLIIFKCQNKTKQINSLLSTNTTPAHGSWQLNTAAIEGRRRQVPSVRQVVFLHLSRTMIKGVPYGGREKPQMTMTLTGLLFSPQLFGMSCQFSLPKS